MKFNTLKSLNYSNKLRKSEDIKFIIIHYTGMQSKRVSIKRLTNPLKEVSCHYLIDRRGSIIQMVDDDKIAWHAGKSRWKNFKNLNSSSIGIELVNKGHNFGYEKFSDIQIKKLIKLCFNLKKKYKIKSSFILGHSDIAPLRKTDPGEKFPWNVMNKNGLGIKHLEIKRSENNFDKKKVRKIFFTNLYKIGYRYFKKNISSQKDKLIIKAFQRRFLQNKVDGKIDQKTFKISHFLALKTKN